MGPDVVLQLLKTFTSVYAIVYRVGQQVMGTVVLKLLKTFTNVHIIV